MANIYYLDMETKNHPSHAFEHVRCLPWIGQDYPTGGMFGKKLLILGESHYCAEGDFPSPTVTTDVIRDYLQAGDTVPREYQAYKKFERSLTGTETDPAMRNRIWQSMAFFNYLQTPMPKPRVAGRQEDYESAVPALFEVLEAIRPEYLIVWGYRLWEHLPGERWERSDTLVVDGKPHLNGCYRLADGTRVKTIAVYHPSTRYAWDYWHKVLRAFGAV